MKLLRKKSVMIIYGICLALILIGTFIDLNISSMLYHEDSIFGEFFNLFGQFPVMLCGFTASAMLLRSLPENKTERLIFLALAVCGILGGLIGSKEVLENLSGFKLILALLIEIAIASALFVYVYRTCSTRNPAKLRRYALFILFTVLIATAFVTVIKIPWGRPRYRSVVAVKDLEYRPWYVIGTSQKKAFADILDSEEFKSFPSGHTCSAGFILTLISLKNVIPALRNKENLLTVIAFAWVILTALGRIIAGAHFLTDVTFGFVFSFTVLILAARWMHIGGKKKTGTN